MIVAVVLARLLGAVGLGIYSLCISVSNILTLPAMLGGEQLLVREVSGYMAKEDYNKLGGILLRTGQASLIASFIVSFVAVVAGMLLFTENRMIIPFALAIFLIPLQASLRLQSSVLRGLRRLFLGQISTIIRPLMLIILVCILFVTTERKVGPGDVISIQIVIVILLVGTSFFLIKRNLPREVYHKKPRFDTPKWIKSAVPFLLVGFTQVLHIEATIIILGIMMDVESVGLYRIAYRGASLILLVLGAVNTTIAPAISELYTKGEISDLQKIINRCMLIVLALTMPMFIALTVFGEWLIPLIFGNDFQEAYVPFVILCIGQIINVLTGPVHLIMNMIGLERSAAQIVFIATPAGLLLNIFLIPLFGLPGAAFASALSMAILNIWLSIRLYNKTGILSTFKIASVFSDISRFIKVKKELQK